MNGVVNVVSSKHLNKIDSPLLPLILFSGSSQHSGRTARDERINCINTPRRLEQSTRSLIYDSIQHSWNKIKNEMFFKNLLAM